MFVLRAHAGSIHADIYQGLQTVGRISHPWFDSYGKPMGVGIEAFAKSHLVRSGQLLAGSTFRSPGYLAGPTFRSPGYPLAERMIVSKTRVDSPGTERRAECSSAGGWAEYSRKPVSASAEDNI